jgi:hypothetical protein
VVATPDPTTGTVISTTAWGHDVYLDLKRISNVGLFSSLGGCTLSTTSSTYVDITSASLSWTKIGGSADTDVEVRIDVDIYAATAGSTGAKLAININGTDYDVKLVFISPLGSLDGTQSAVVRVTGVTAGSWTPKLRVKRTSGTGTLTVDSLCNVSFRVAEIPL